jgi:hypothetical protein
VELRRWLEERGERIAERWHAEIRAREDRRGDPGGGFLGGVLDDLVSFIPHCLSDHRDAAEEIWQQATHLYGSLALQRGLAAGEVVEELQLLREVVFRFLLEARGGRVLEESLPRDLLILNRVIDQGVVRASVAYVDDLFFAHLQGTGVPEAVTSELREEIQDQLDTFRKELETRAKARRES